MRKSKLDSDSGFDRPAFWTGWPFGIVRGGDIPPGPYPWSSPFPPGGVADLTARPLAAALEPHPQTADAGSE